MQENYLHKLLEAKERRKSKQDEMLTKHGCTLLSLSVNMPGDDKNHPLALSIFAAMKEMLLTALKKENISIKKSQLSKDISGPYMLMAIKEDASKIKMLTCKLEESHELGRFMDMDIFDEHGKLYSRTEFGFAPRKCYLCESFAHECSRSKAHHLSDIIDFMQKKVKKYAST